MNGTREGKHACKCPVQTLLGIEVYRFKVEVKVAQGLPQFATVGLPDPLYGEGSETIRRRVDAARTIQRQRLAPFRLHTSAAKQPHHIRTFCQLDAEGEKLLVQVTEKLGLSARSYTRILKLTRTITGLARCEQITPAHVAESIQYRRTDRVQSP